MSEHEEEREEQEAREVQVAEPHPGAIHYLDHKDGANFENDIVKTFIDSARDQGIINEEEHVTTRNLVAIVRSAAKLDLIPADLTEKEALILCCWWWGFGAGYGFHEFHNKHMIAQAMMGAAADMLGLENPNPFLQEEEDEPDSKEDPS